jgi:predicted CoA-binding protein
MNYIIKGLSMECEFPTVNSNKEEIKEIFENVKTIAVLGLSPDETKASHRVAKYLQSVGYKIIPVYPKEEVILGEKVYRSLKEIPFQVDMVDIFRKPAAFDAIADACIERGDIKIFWGQQGLVNNAAAEKAEKAGMKVVQNQCSMVEHRALFG